VPVPTRECAHPGRPAIAWLANSCARPPEACHRNAALRSLDRPARFAPPRRRQAHPATWPGATNFRPAWRHLLRRPCCCRSRALLALRASQGASGRTIPAMGPHRPAESRVAVPGCCSIPSRRWCAPGGRAAGSSADVILASSRLLDEGAPGWPPGPAGQPGLPYRDGPGFSWKGSVPFPHDRLRRPPPSAWPRLLGGDSARRPWSSHPLAAPPPACGRRPRLLLRSP